MSSFGQNQIDNEDSLVFSFLIPDSEGFFLMPRADIAVFDGVKIVLLERQHIRRRPLDNPKIFDTLTFSEDEKKYINMTLDSLRTYFWTKKTMQQVGLSGFTLIDDTCQVQDDAFNDVVYQIVKPIFVRN